MLQAPVCVQHFFSVSRRKRGVFHRSESGHLGINTQAIDTYGGMLIFRHSKSLAVLLVIANATPLNQVFLIWTASNYPIHLRGMLPFNINHSVRLHQPHCVLVTVAAEWWMCACGPHSPTVCLGIGQFSKQMISKGSVHLRCTFSLLIWTLAVPSFSPCH